MGEIQGYKQSSKCWLSERRFLFWWAVVSGVTVAVAVPDLVNGRVVLHNWWDADMLTPLHFGNPLLVLFHMTGTQLERCSGLGTAVNTGQLGTDLPTLFGKDPGEETCGSWKEGWIHTEVPEERYTERNLQILNCQHSEDWGCEQYANIQCQQTWAPERAFPTQCNQSRTRTVTTTNNQSQTYKNLCIPVKEKRRKGANI